MNCKPGDLAVVIGGAFSPQNIGAIVKVIKLLPNGGVLDGKAWFPTSSCPTWLVESCGKKLTWGHHKPSLRRAYSDRCLRPIRDQDGDDETLTWAGKPEGVTA